MVNDSSIFARVARALRFQENLPVAQEGSIVPLASQSKAIGTFGTLSYGGYPSEEYLASLRGKKRADIFDQMRRSDPQVKMCLTAVKNPIKSANWEVQPGGDSDEEKQDAELIEQILFNDMIFSQFLNESLTMLDFGHAVFEPIHSAVMNHKRFGSYNSLACIAFRSPRTIERWNLDEPTGSLLSVSQYAYGDIGKLVDIPSENLMVMTLDREGANYEGISALRPCYGSWFRKNNYLKLNAVGIEKFAIPTPLVEVPEGKQGSAQFNMMIEVIEHYLTHQKNYLTYPEGWKITLNTNTYDPQKVETSVDNEDKRMVKSFLANFLELGMGGAGSFALSNDLSDFFLTGLDHVANLIAEPLNRCVIPKLITMNRGQRMKYPTLKHSGISDKAGKELAEILKFLGDAQYIRPDDQLEEHLRQRYQLPKASELGRRTPQPTQGFGAAPAQSPMQPATLAERIILSEAKRKRLEG